MSRKKKRRENEALKLAILAAVLQVLAAMIGLVTQIVESLKR